jgi:hypothetical protein
MKTKQKNTAEKAFLEFLENRFSISNQQRIIIILEKEVEKIVEFRKKWHIPPAGFEDRVPWTKWYKNLAKIAPERIRDIEYIEFEIFYFFSRFKPIKSILSTDLENYERRTIIKKNIYAVFEFEVKKLVRDLKLDQDLCFLIAEYVWYGKMALSKVENTNIIVSQRITNSPEAGELERKVSMIFGANTRKKDIDDMYRFFVSGLQNTISGCVKDKTKTIKDIEIYILIYTLYKQEKTVKEIANILAEKGKAFDEANIRRIIRKISAY